MDITNFSAREISPPITAALTKDASEAIPLASSVISAIPKSGVKPALTNKYFGVPPMA